MSLSHLESTDTHTDTKTIKLMSSTRLQDTRSIYEDQLSFYSINYYRMVTNSLKLNLKSKYATVASASDRFFKDMFLAESIKNEYKLSV